MVRVRKSNVHAPKRPHRQIELFAHDTVSVPKASSKQAHLGANIQPQHFFVAYGQTHPGNYKHYG